MTASAGVQVLDKAGSRSSEASTAVGSKADLSSTLEKGNIWDGYLEDDLPEKVHGHWLRNLRFQVLSMYRKIFGIIFTTNVAIFIALCVRGGDEVTSKRLGKIVVANLFVAIMMRQDQIVNGFYNVFTSVPRS